MRGVSLKVTVCVSELSSMEAMFVLDTILYPDSTVRVNWNTAFIIGSSKHGNANLA